MANRVRPCGTFLYNATWADPRQSIVLEKDHRHGHTRIRIFTLFDFSQDSLSTIPVGRIIPST